MILLLVFVVSCLALVESQSNSISHQVTDATRLGLLAPLIGVSPVPGGNVNTLPFPGSPNSNSEEGCFCIPLNQQCTPISIRTSMVTLINTRIVNINSGNPCPQEEKLCCLNEGPSNFIPQTPLPASLLDLQSCGVRVPIPFRPSTAGEAQFGSYPWMTAILEQSNNFVSGGALIAANWVLTTAHKVSGREQLKARVGDHDLSIPGENPSYPQQEIAVSRIIIHPNYKAHSLINDVALLQLAKPANLNLHIRPVCLPERNQRFTGQRCYVSGWGLDAFNNGAYQVVLKEVDVPVVDEFECEQRLRATRLGSTFQLDKISFMCAGGEEGKDSCTGDGGSPLVCQEVNQWTVVGLVAWGVGCAQDRVPGVYVNIANYANFIRQNIGF